MYTMVMANATPFECQWRNLVEIFAFAHIRELNAAVYDRRATNAEEGTYRQSTAVCINDVPGADTIALLFDGEESHYRAILPKYMEAPNLASDSTVSFNKKEEMKEQKTKTADIPSEKVETNEHVRCNEPPNFLDP